MNLLTIEWQNRGINMWTITEGSITCVKGTPTYDLPTDTIDLLDQVVRTGSGSQSLQQDITLNRISVSTYASIPNKLIQGRPIQVWVERLRDRPTMTLWPIPDKDSTYTIEYFYMRRIEDAGQGSETPDMPFRFLPCLVAGLAYYIAMKVPELGSRLGVLKESYEEQFALAAGEDREKTSSHFVPSIGRT